MNKALAVALAEYLNAVRSKGFILGVLMMPIMVGVMILVQTLADRTADLSDRRIAIVDHTGRLADPILAAAERYNTDEAFAADPAGNRTQSKPRWVVEVLPPPAADSPDPLLDLSDRVRSGDLFAFAILTPDILDPDAGVSVRYYTQTPTYDDLPNWLRGQVNSLVHEARLADARIDAAVVESIARINRNVGLTRFGLVERTETGDATEAREGNEALSILIPAAGMFIIFFLVMSACPAMLNAVLEEKMQRIAELLVAAVTPFDLMLGKLLGGVLVALTLAVLYVGAGVYLVHRYNLGDLISADYYLWFTVFTILGLLMYGSMFVAIGAACSEIRDSQSLMTPAMLLCMMPIWCWFIVIRDPNSTAAIALSLFPPFTPMLMFLRIGASPSPPMWQIILSVVLTTGFTLVCVWGAARVFRIGILSYGQPPTFRKLIAWAISGK